MRTRNQTLLDSAVVPGPLESTREHIVPPGSPDPTDYLDNSGWSAVQMDLDVESIDDDPSPGRQFKAVLHTRRKLHREGGSEEVMDNDVNGDGTHVDRYTVRGVNPHWRNWGAYGNIDFNNLTVTFPIELDKQVRKLQHEFYAMNEVDNLTNLVESPGLFTGVQSFNRNLVRGIRAMKLKRVQSFTQSGSPRLEHDFVNTAGAIRNWSQLVSGAYLYYSFGIAPLISDMAKIYKSVAKIDRQLKMNRSHAGKVVNLHSICHGTCALTGLDNGYGSPGTSGKYWSTEIIGDKPKRIVTVQGIRIQRYETEVFQNLDFMLKKFLSGGPASFLWERIPYSFVVDWFVDLSGVVDSLDRFLTFNPANIKQTCYSIGYNLKFPVKKFPQLPNWPSSSSDWTITALNELSYYHRSPYSSSPMVGESGRFGKKQIGLSAALLTQIVSNLRRGPS